MKFKKIQGRVIVLILMMGLASPGIAQNSKPWTSQEKLKIVFEGTRNPSQLQEICNKYESSETTWNAWKQKFLYSTELISDPYTQTDVAVNKEMKLSAIEIGDDVLTSDPSEAEEDSWRIQAGLKFWHANFDRNKHFMGDRQSEPFQDSAPFGGFALAFSKGKNAISLSLLGAFDKWSQEENLTVNGTPITMREDWENYYGDIRFHRMLTENVSASLGYKFIYNETERWERNHTTGVVTIHDAWAISHGPGFGLNASYVLGDTKFSLWSSFFIVPYGWSYQRGRSTSFSGGTSTEDRSSASESGGWFINPEVGLRYWISRNTNLSLSYRWEIMGGYQDGPAETVSGFALSLQHHFYAFAKQTEIATKKGPQSSDIELGDDSVAVDLPEKAEDRWKVHAGLKYWYATRTREYDFTGDTVDDLKTFRDSAPLGGVAFTFSKGKNAISLSFLGPLDKWSQEENLTWGGQPVKTRIERKNYYADIRFHRRLTEDTSVFLGYKFVYLEKERWRMSGTTGNLLNLLDAEAITHGPSFGLNASYAIGDTKFSLWGSFLIVPYAWDHLRYTYYSSGTETTKSTNTGEWYFINPEVGLRYSFTKNTSISLGYRWDMWGRYTQGPDVMENGPCLTVSTTF